MRIVDANVLLYAVNTTSAHHALARDWLDRALASDETVGLPWTSLLAFIRLATNPAVFPNPLPVDDALRVVRLWLAAPAALPVGPGDRHVAILSGLLASSGTGGNLVTDAHLAALAIEHDATLVSFDRDFGRFDGLAWELPGAARSHRPRKP
jgi:toxin-antitoxin system PIN domain toxin